MTAAMIVKRPADDRGTTQLDWLDSRHSFSFADYHDPEQMGFRTLRVINEDRVAPGTGFGVHPHRDMEIITVVLEGAVEHRDSLGNRSVIQPGDVQRMTAGTGIRHSEANPSTSEWLHLLQIWIVPHRKGLKPGYEQRVFPVGEGSGGLRLVGSHDGRDGSLLIHQDVELHWGAIALGERVGYRPASGRGQWLQVALGELTVNGVALGAGDGAAIADQEVLDIHTPNRARFLLFDLG